MSHRGSAPRVLLVEDSAALRTATEEVLRGLGVEPVGAESGALALQLCDRESFSLVLMDLELPGLDGYKVCSVMRARLGATCPPVVALSARLGEPERRRCLAVGMVDTLRKPVHPSLLERTIQRWARGDSPVEPESVREPPPSGTRSGVNREFLQRLIGLESRVGPDGWLDSLISDYRASASEHRQGVVVALRSADLEALADRAHALSSDAASLGALRMAELCAQLEGSARELHGRPGSDGRVGPERFHGVEVLVEALSAEMSHVERDLVTFQQSRLDSGLGTRKAN